MDKIRCIECGAELTADVTECPDCGCPVVPTKMEHMKKKEKNITIKMKQVNLSAIISLFLGVVTIMMGVKVLNNKELAIDVYSTKQYSVDSAEFGADFYTEIYRASDTIVDELNGINSGIEILSQSTSEIISIICYSAGMLIISIGICVIAISCNHIVKERI